ncbi:MAG TPA: hypothetical protein VFM34_06765 [Moraxellaceae bacterium]|nr:hypothetical protein [Moraxellaceae bacterium]
MTRLRRPALIPFLAGSLGLLATSLAIALPERPRQENYPDYSKYIQALVDYQRALDTPAPEKEKTKSAIDPDKLCQAKGGDKEKKKNSCEGKYLYVEDVIPDENVQKTKPQKATATSASYENLEDAISRSGNSLFPDLVTDNGPSTTPTQLPQQELSPTDLSESGVAGLLGLFQNVRMQSLGSNASSGGMYGSSSGGAGGGNDVNGLLTDGTLRATLDNFLIQLSSVDYSVLGSLVSFGDGYSIVNAAVRLNDQGNGIVVGLSSRTVTPVYIVDRDGVPQSSFDGAGAIALDRMTIVVPYVEANLQAVTTSTSDQSALRVDVSSMQPIYVDFSNSTIGVAPASRDGSWIGDATPFIRFGTNSMLTIAPGTNVSAVISRPSGLDNAFITLNGHIGNISLQDVSFVDAASGGSMGFGRLGLTNLDLVDAKVYVSNQTITLDTGHSFSNVGIDIERFYLGPDDGNHIVGDFYARGARVDQFRLSATPH